MNFDAFWKHGQRDCAQLNHYLRHLRGRLTFSSSQNKMTQSKFPECGGQVLAELNADPEYHRLVSEGLRFGRARGSAVEHALRFRSPRIMLKLGGALCLQGSHARTDGIAISAIDIVHVHMMFLIRSAMNLSGPRISTYFAAEGFDSSYHVIPNVYEQESLVVWLSLNTP